MKQSNKGEIMENKFVFKYTNTPVGKLKLIASGKGLVAILWENEDFSRIKMAEPIENENDSILLETEKQLQEYFVKTRTEFDLPLDFIGTDFQKKVWEGLLSIPFGKTKSYGELAALIGDPKAARAVGGALNKNPISIIVPCHRVIGASGKLTGFAGGLDNKTCLLNVEKNSQDLVLF